MLIPIRTECERIVAEGEEIGAGGGRQVYIHDDYPDIVVKKSHNTESWWGDQNTAEAENYRLLSSKTLPDRLRIPKTVLVGEYIVQEFVDGDQPGPAHHSYRDTCLCTDVTGLTFCWKAVVEQVCWDSGSKNVVIVDNYVYLIDLGAGVIGGR